MIDTHCHLDFSQFDNDRDAVIKRFFDSGGTRIINVGSSLEGSRASVNIAKENPAIFASVGIHPHDAASVNSAVLDEIRHLAGNEKVVAIGEVGLDYYRTLSPEDRQEEAFRSFIRMSIESGLPLILHSRDAGDDILRMLKDESGGSASGVMHCFSGDREFLDECLEMGIAECENCGIKGMRKKDDLFYPLAGEFPITPIRPLKGL